MASGLTAPMNEAWAVAVVAALACAAILRGLLASGLAWRLATDVPNHRSLHTRPTPRVGGWGIVPVSAVAIALAAPALWPVAALAFGLAALSLIDDRRGLSARLRFAGHLIAVAALLFVYPAPIHWWTALALAFLLLWLINLYNFMDGADGLAGGMALFGFGSYAIAALASPMPAPVLAIACAAVAGASAGFLWLNFHPAKLFLGDAGSIPLGFLAGALGYWGWQAHVWPIWFPPTIFAPFILDASITLLKRLLRGEPFWKAHREHYYQRVVRSGIGHARMARSAYIVMAAGSAVALWALGRPAPQQWACVGLWYGALAILGGAIDYHWRRRSPDASN